MVVHGQNLITNVPVLLLVEIIAHEWKVPLFRIRVLVSAHRHPNVVYLEGQREAADGNVGWAEQQNVRALMEVLEISRQEGEFVTQPD